MGLFRSLKIKAFKHIVLYGAGNFAGQIKEDLIRNGFSLDFCVVTQKDENQNFLGEVPIYTFEEKVEEIKKENITVVIAVSKDYETEILNHLEEYEIKNILFRDDLYRKSHVTLDSYGGKSEKEYIDGIAEWYVEQYPEKGCELEEIKHFLVKKIHQKEKISQKITVIGGDVSPRMIKIVKALSERGYSVVVLLCPEAYVRSVCINELQKLHISYYKCNYIEELMYHLILEQGQVIHFFSCWIHSVTAYTLIKMKSLFSPIVYDEYDIINEMYVNMRQEWLLAERFCLEHADAICNRGWEMDYFINRKNYPINGKVLRFLDYCKDGKNIYQGEKEEESLSICYVGGVITEKEEPTLSIACWIELAEICKKNQCEIHIYPSEWDEKRYGDYIELEKNNPYFHFHKSVPFEQLELELAQYDYGIFPIKKDFLKHEKDGYYYSKVLIYTCVNKYFDYLDAGLPIIAGLPLKMVESLEKKGVLINWKNGQYDFEYLRKMKDKMKSNVMIVKEELRIGRHINKLLDFYESI